MNKTNGLKAYSLSIKDDDDQGQVIVFAENATKAKAFIVSTDLMWDSYLDVRVHRAKAFDGMENLSKAELAKNQWRDGWRWFDMDYPDPDEATDEEFLSWYENMFGDKS